MKAMEIPVIRNIAVHKLPEPIEEGGVVTSYFVIDREFVNGETKEESCSFSNLEAASEWIAQQVQLEWDE